MDRNAQMTWWSIQQFSLIRRVSTVTVGTGGATFGRFIQAPECFGLKTVKIDTAHVDPPSGETQTDGVVDSYTGRELRTRHHGTAASPMIVFISRMACSECLWVQWISNWNRQCHIRV
jgi:hypothetical protein